MKSAYVTLKDWHETIECDLWYCNSGCLTLFHPNGSAIKSYAPGVWESIEWDTRGDDNNE